MVLFPPRPKPHGEAHFRASATVRDVVIGAADGLTVPFALAAGLAGSLGTGSIVVAAGLAEIAAGSIAMGLGGYLAARSDVEHYESEYAREVRETIELPVEERAEVERIFRDHGLEGTALANAVDAITAEQTRWVDFMMRYELGLERPDPQRAPVSAFTIAASYVLGGLVPLCPYMLIADLGTALRLSASVTLLALFGFGFAKARVTGTPAFRSGLRTMVIGGLAALAAYAVAGLAR